MGELDHMPECPICNKEFSPHGPNSYRAHLQSKHPRYWEKARRLRQLATLTLVISLALTLLLVTVFYCADQLGYTMMGLATLFLALSSAFSLKERGLFKTFTDKSNSRKKREDKE
jgi:hypothetical protein